MGASVVPMVWITYRRTRIEPEYTQKINTSIARDGIMHPPILSRDYEVINGRNRIRAARALGWEHIPAYVCDVSLHDARDLN
jgi:ParB-like chromosome segregation protein Spo0J